MNQNIQDNLVKLLDAYLADLKSEADTVTHIVNYISDSSAARAALSEQLEAYFGTCEKEKKPEPVVETALPSPPDSAQIQGKAEALLKSLADFNMNQPDASASKSM